MNRDWILLPSIRGRIVSALLALCVSLVRALGSHWGGFRGALGCLSPGYQHALGWL